jgi:hypothetical protein
MIVALILSQVVVPAGPSEAIEPATGWQCSYSSTDGSKFELSGIFPEFPVGSPANKPLPTMITGTGPAFLLGNKEVNSFNPVNGTRHYQVSFSDNGGDRYNLNFQFEQSKATAVDITHWMTKKQRLVTYAKGKCVADFNPQQDVK